MHTRYQPLLMVALEHLTSAVITHSTEARTESEHWQLKPGTLGSIPGGCQLVSLSFTPSNV